MIAVRQLKAKVATAADVMCKSKTFPLLSILLSVACTILPPAKTLQAQSADADSIILEITDTFQGMWPFAGTYVHFRLYKSGRVEYEKPERNRDTAKWEAIKYDMRLNHEELQEVISLAENSDFQKARQRYDELWSGVDARYIATISYKPRNKRIELVNFIADSTSPANYYPESVEKLMQQVEALRERNK